MWVSVLGWMALALGGLLSCSRREAPAQADGTEAAPSSESPGLPRDHYHPPPDPCAEGLKGYEIQSPCKDWGIRLYSALPKTSAGFPHSELSSLRDLIKQSHKDWPEILDSAAGITWSRNRGTATYDWKQLTAEEKFDSIRLMALLKGLGSQDSLFLQGKLPGLTRTVKDFSQTVLALAEGKKLRLRHLTPDLVRGLNPLSRLAGSEEGLVYNATRNELYLNPRRDHLAPYASSRLVHELLHLYQDQARMASNRQVVESDAFLLQALFLCEQLSWQKEGLSEISLRSLIEREFPDAQGQEWRPAILALWWGFYHKKGDIPEAKQAREKFIRALNALYYVYPLFKERLEKSGPLAGRMAAARLIENDKDQALQGLNSEIHAHRAMRKRAFKDLKEFIETHPQMEKAQLKSMEEKFQGFLDIWILETLLELHYDRIASDTFDPTEALSVQPFKSPYREQMDALADLQPLRFESMQFDGI